VAGAADLRFMANASPVSAGGSDVTSISIKAEDTGPVLKSLDQPARKALGEALLAAASTSWPNARVTLLVSDPTGKTPGQIVATHDPKSGANTVLAT
jgi:hypothetical protein